MLWLRWVEHGLMTFGLGKKNVTTALNALQPVSGQGRSIGRINDAIGLR